MNIDYQTFLDQCEKSSQTAYDAFKNLLEKLESPETRKDARQFLNLVIQKCAEEDSQNFLKKYHFVIEKLAIAQSDEEEQVLYLFQIPSVFSPEDWSFTFFEGLSRYSKSEFYGKTIVELGTGNGWISIALAKRTLASKVIGLDINPKAITCAKINMYLNCLNSDGSELVDLDGKSFLGRILFAESDLLEYCQNNQIFPDRVIGCIPQVLNPDTAFIKSIVPDTVSDEFLYSLSNYCGHQGFIEDQFGLGLIAKAIEDAATLCKPGYKLIFNLGGRPGNSVLMRMFQRRGYEVKKIWETRVLQAPDTEISSLVEIENSSLHRFEFFMGLSATEPISARTAKVYQEAGGTIAHALGVYEAKAESHGPIKKILAALKDKSLISARSGLDLAFEDRTVGEEKISFLADLTEKVDLNLWPYGNTRGDPHLRRRIAEFLRSYFYIPLSAKNILLTPHRFTFIKNYLWLYQPKIALVEKSLVGAVPKEWLASDAVKILEAPQQVDLLCKLVETIGPKCLITKLQSEDVKTPDSYLRLVETCRRIGTLLAVDISDELDLSSSPRANGIFNTLSEFALEPHVTLFCGLVKNKVYSDLELCFVVSENSDVLKHLEYSAELTYSRVPTLSQFYYDRLLSRLLNFQLKNLKRERNIASNAMQIRIPSAPDKDFFNKFITLDECAQAAFQMPAIVGNEIAHLANSKKVIRLDYGENEFSAPAEVKLHVFESFLRQNISSVESDPTDEISKLLETRFGILRSINDKFIVSDGVSSLFAGISQQCAIEKIEILFPQGYYGSFLAAAKYFGSPIRIIETDETNQYKLNANDLQKYKNAVLYLNAPIVNPTGAIYTQAEISKIMEMASKNKITIILDATFCGLHFSESEPRWMISGGYENYCILGSTSKEFATGGLRIGYAWTRSDWLAKSLQNCVNVPHFTLQYVLKKVLQDFNQKDPSLLKHLENQRIKILERASHLGDVLNALGWTVLNPQGGLFLVAKPPSKFLEKHKNDICKFIFEQTGVLLNQPHWAGISDYCRFVLSVEEGIFEEAIKRLKNINFNL